jgi:sortase A
MQVTELIGSTARILAVLCLGTYLGARADAEFGRAQGIAAFESERLADAHAASGRIQDAATLKPDQSRWSAGRIEAWRESLATGSQAPLGLLRLPDVDLVAPVYAGTGELALNRGLGWIEGTAPPGESGNVGIAGHRDGFFRALQDVGHGDVVELVTPDSTLRYRIDSTVVVDPDAVHVLAPTDSSVLTLVTCYPFYYVGHAPRRYIVRARLDRDGPDPLKRVSAN